MCPAFGKTCPNCLRKEHFAKCSKTRQLNTVEQDTEEVSDTSDSYNGLHFDSIYVDEVSTANRFCPLTLQKDVIIPLKIDTGAQANMLTFQDFRNLKGVHIRPANEVLRRYTQRGLYVSMVNADYK